jgi:hypothetical protein
LAVTFAFANEAPLASVTAPESEPPLFWAKIAEAVSRSRQRHKPVWRIVFIESPLDYSVVGAKASDRKLEWRKSSGDVLPVLIKPSRKSGYQKSQQ